MIIIIPVKRTKKYIAPPLRCASAVAAPLLITGRVNPAP
jgi:hypothetical protein